MVYTVSTDNKSNFYVVVKKRKALKKNSQGSTKKLLLLKSKHALNEGAFGNVRQNNHIAIQDFGKTAFKTDKSITNFFNCQLRQLMSRSIASAS